MKKVLITGAGGYIGAHVLSAVASHLKTGSIIASDIRPLNMPGIRSVTEDLFDTKNFQNFIEEYGVPDVCIHLAWRDGFNHNSMAHLDYLAAHYTFIKNLIDAGCASVSVMGTMHEVGYYEGAIDAATPCLPLSLYGVAKNALRQAVLTYADGKKTKIKWLRAFYITGDDARNQSIFSKIAKMAAEGQKTFPFTSGLNKYDFIDVEELARQISLASLQNEVNGIINCCSGVPVSLKDKVEAFIAEKKLDIRPEYGVYPIRKYDSPIIYGDNGLIQKILSNYSE